MINLSRNEIQTDHAERTILKSRTESMKKKFKRISSKQDQTVIIITSLFFKTKLNYRNYYFILSSYSF